MSYLELKSYLHFNMKVYPDVYDLKKEILINNLNYFMKKFEINSLIRASHFLSQIEHESAYFSTTQEIADGSKYNNRIDLGNINENDGPRYKGRGLIQLTGKINYQKFSNYKKTIDKNSLDLEKEPNNELLASNIVYATEASCWFWQLYKGLNQYADEDDLIFITYSINGGFNGYDDRKNKTIKLLEKLKVKKSNDLNKKLGIYNVNDSKLYNYFVGIYSWARYFDPKYVKLEGTGKNLKEAINAYQRSIFLYDNNKVKINLDNTNRYNNAKNRINSLLLSF